MTIPTEKCHLMQIAQSLLEDCMGGHTRGEIIEKIITTIQTEADRRVEAEQNRLSHWLNHRPTCYLYTEEGSSDQCDCGLYKALTITPNQPTPTISSDKE